MPFIVKIKLLGSTDLSISYPTMTQGGVSKAHISLLKGNLPPFSANEKNTSASCQYSPFISKMRTDSHLLNTLSASSKQQSSQSFGPCFAHHVPCLVRLLWLLPLLLCTTTFDVKQKRQPCMISGHLMTN